MVALVLVLTVMVKRQSTKVAREWECQTSTILTTAPDRTRSRDSGCVEEQLLLKARCSSLVGVSAFKLLINEHCFLHPYFNTFC